jgi:hypothetical protein
MLILANFAEFPQTVDLNRLQNEWWSVRGAVDLITDQPVPQGDSLRLEPYQFMWLAPR